MQSVSRRNLKSQQMFSSPFSNQANTYYVIEILDSYIRFTACKYVYKHIHNIYIYIYIYIYIQGYIYIRMQISPVALKISNQWDQVFDISRRASN